MTRLNANHINESGVGALLCAGFFFKRRRLVAENLNQAGNLAAFISNSRAKIRFYGYAHAGAFNHDVNDFDDFADFANPPIDTNRLG